MSLLTSVDVPRRSVARLEPIIGAERFGHLMQAADQFRQRIAGRIIWNVNSTAAGGGVAEMLQVIVGYVVDLEVPILWTVISGDAEFFAITKRLHNQIHGFISDGPFTPDDAEHYARMLDANAADLVDQVRPGDLVLLHDPQTAALAAPLSRAGALVAWRCHIGVDWENDATRAGWEFLRPHISAADAFVFSRREYVPSWLPQDRVSIIPPSIDPYSPKNQPLEDGDITAILTAIGVLEGDAPNGRVTFTRRDGTGGCISRPGAITAEGRPGSTDQVVLQVSRWDRLKDMGGVMQAFADHVVPRGPGHLMLVGPSVAGVTDDPEGAAVYGECLLQWRSLPAEARRRIMLVTLPLIDIDENAAMVNALQRHATIITQKSLAEGFGLTVAEGMWKGRPVIGSAVGGINDQVTPGTGILLPDPHDLKGFGEAVSRLLNDPQEAKQMGETGQAFIREQYVGDLHLLRYADLFNRMLPRA